MRPGGGVDAANAVVPDVADQEPALGVEGDAVGAPEHRLDGGAAVPGETGLTGAGDGGDDAGDGVHPAHHVAVALDDVEMARAVELDLVRHVQGGLGGGTAVAVVAPLAVSSDGGRGPGLAVQPPDALVVQIAEVQRAVRADDDAVGIGDLCVGETRGAVADDGGDRGRLRVDEADEQQRRCQTDLASHDVSVSGGPYPRAAHVSSRWSAVRSALECPGRGPPPRPPRPPARRRAAGSRTRRAR